jgi:hypothetical protein
MTLFNARSSWCFSARLRRCPQRRRFFLLGGLHLDLFATSPDALLLRRLVSLDSRRTLCVVASLRDVEARRRLRRLSLTTPSSILHFLLLRHLSLSSLFSLLSSLQPSFPSSPTVRRFFSLFSSPSQNRSVDKPSSLLPPFLLLHISFNSHTSLTEAVERSCCCSLAVSVSRLASTPAFLALSPSQRPRPSSLALSTQHRQH